MQVCISTCKSSILLPFSGYNLQNFDFIHFRMMIWNGWKKIFPQFHPRKFLLSLWLIYWSVFFLQMFKLQILGLSFKNLVSHCFYGRCYKKAQLLYWWCFVIKTFDFKVITEWLICFLFYMFWRFWPIMLFLFYRFVLFCCFFRLLPTIDSDEVSFGKISIIETCSIFYGCRFVRNVWWVFLANWPDLLFLLLNGR